jgi:hypothetical protein
MITPKHIDNSIPLDAVATEDRDTNHVADPVVRQGTLGIRGVGDTTTGPGDIPVRTNQAADESSYAAAPATDGQHAADAETSCGTTRPTFRIEVEDGHVVASLDPVLTDAAADVLWRIIEKARRKEETG